jgi:hypothetical protein
MENGNLKLEISYRHLTYDALSYDSQYTINVWAKIIRQALSMYKLDIEAANSIIVHMSSHFKVNFTCEAVEWMRLLVMKWRAKTPDIKQQGEAIAFAIYKQRRV